MPLRRNVRVPQSGGRQLPKELSRMPCSRTTLAGRALRRLLGAALLALVLTVLPAVSAADGKPETKPVTPPPASPALHMRVPENVDDLRNLEKQVKTVVEKVTPATV